MAYHFIGIKGTGMASLATILFDENKEVNGSDIEKYIFTQDELEKRGLYAKICHIRRSFLATDTRRYPLGNRRSSSSVRPLSSSMAIP